MKTRFYIEEGAIDTITGEIRATVTDAVTKLHLPQTTKASDLLTRQETAKLLRISISTLSRHIRSGVIPASKVGRRVLIRRSSLEKALLSINN